MAGGGNLSEIELDGHGLHLGILFIILIIFSILFELLTHKIEHVRNNKTFTTINILTFDR